MVKVKVNGREIESKGMVKDALISAGIKINQLLDDREEVTSDSIFMPCNCGGCWTCAVKINGKPSLACITPLKEDMYIETLKYNSKQVLRIVSGFGAHYVGGVGTPYFLKTNKKPIEVVVFTHGCNLRCPQCQNHKIAFTDLGSLLDPQETAQILWGLKETYKVDTITFSGGESTLNRPWLLKSIESMKKNKNKLNIHVDTNGTILTPHYLDQLVKAGMNYIGIDLKGGEVSTFQLITGIEDYDLASQYLKNSWDSVKYLIENYNMDYVFKTESDKELNDFQVKSTNRYPEKPSIFLGIGIPYNKQLISKTELMKMGEKIKAWDPKIQVCILDYRPEFRRTELIKPDWQEMIEIKNMFNELGLKTVIVQTERGHFGP